MNDRVPIALFVLVVASAAGCNKHQDLAPGKTEPAKVAHHVTEETLNTIQLTAKAEQRLGIHLAAVQFVEVQRRRTVGGEVVIPAGQTIVVSAPIAGTLSAPEDAPTTGLGAISH